MVKNSNKKSTKGINKTYIKSAKKLHMQQHIYTMVVRADTLINNYL